MTPEQRERARDKHRSLKGLSHQQRQALRSRWESLDADQRQRLRRRLEHMNPEQRQQALQRFLQRRDQKR